MPLLRNATLALAALAIAWPAAQPRAGDALAGSSWTILAISGDAADKAGTLAFNDGKLAGKAACNRYFASYEASDDTITVGLVGATRMMCPAIALEQKLFDALAAVRKHRRDGANLVLSDAAGEALLVLAPAP